MKKLQIVLSKQEKVARITANIDNLKSNGEISEDEYSVMTTKYTSIRTVINQDLIAIRAELSRSQGSFQQSIDAMNTESRNLDLKLKVGEIDSQMFQNQMTKLNKRLINAENQKTDTEQLLAADTAAKVGGYVDVPLNGDSGGIMDKFKNLDIGAVGKSLKSITETLPTTQSSLDGISKVGIAGNFMMAIGVFMTMVSVPFMGSVSLKDIGSFASLAGSEAPFLLVNAWWILLVLGVAGIATNFVMERKYAKHAMIASGGIVILAEIYGIIRLIAATSGGGGQSFGDILGILGFGFYVIQIGAILSLVAGIRYKQSR